MSEDSSAEKFARIRAFDRLNRLRYAHMGWRYTDPNIHQEGRVCLRQPIRTVPVRGSEFTPREARAFLRAHTEREFLQLGRFGTDRSWMDAPSGCEHAFAIFASEAVRSETKSLCRPGTCTWCIFETFDDCRCDKACPDSRTGRHELLLEPTCVCGDCGTHIRAGKCCHVQARTMCRPCARVRAHGMGGRIPDRMPCTSPQFWQQCGMGSLADWYPLRRVGERTYCINYNAESERCGDYAVLERHRSTKSPYRVSLYEKV